MRLALNTISITITFNITLISRKLDSVLKYHLSPFSTRRICSRDAKRKQEFSNVIGWRKSSLLRQPITLLNSCFRFASREQIRLVENGLYSNRPERVAQLAEHWASIPRVRHTFQPARGGYRLRIAAQYHSVAYLRHNISRNDSFTHDRFPSSFNPVYSRRLFIRTIIPTDADDFHFWKILL